MSATTVDTEPTLFDPRPVEAAPTAQTAKTRAPAAAAPTGTEEVASDASPQTDIEARSDAEHAQDATGGAESAASVGADGEKPAVLDRKRLKEQLDALKRKEAELRRALAVTDHPELADAIRTLEASAYCVTRAETKISQGFSKGEARRREVIEKKLSSLREKRSELDTQIEALEGELAGLGTQRIAEFELERKNALKDLMIALATHDAALVGAGYEAQSLLPEIAEWMPELEAVAREVSSAASN